jgi:hypothetical protein
MEKVFLPAIVEVRKSLGPTGSEFEVRLILNTSFPGSSSFNRHGAGRGGSGTSTPSFLGGGGNSSAPVLEEVVVTIPIPRTVRNITDMQASRGEAIFAPGNDTLEWRIPTKDSGTVSGTATLRCTVVGHQNVDDELEEDNEGADADANLLQGYYDASTAASYQVAEEAATGTTKRKTKKKKKTTKTTKTKKSSKSAAASALVASDQDSGPQTSPNPSKPQSPAPESSSSPAAPAPAQSSPQSSSLFYTPPRKTKTQLNASLMPNSASVSFSVKGWLPSGLRVDSLNIDPRRSRGLGEGVKPYKGVKYLCVSRKGVEARC